LDDIEAGKCPPFVGAGFSLNARLPVGKAMPAWPELTAHLASIGQLAADSGGPTVASEFEKRFGRVQLLEAIQKALHTDVGLLNEAIRARNKAMHELEEPSRDDARLVLRVVRDFVQKYLREA
jgi:hypothetical protein